MTAPAERRAAFLAAAMSIAGGCTTLPPAEPAPASRGNRETSQAPEPRRAPVTEVAVTTRPWRFAVYDGEVLVTPHYRIYTTIRERETLEQLPLFVERALAHYTTVLAPLPDPPGALETYLFASRNQWEAKTRQMLPDQATAYMTLGRGGFTTRGTSVLYDIGRSDTLAIAAHEGWHQYAQRTLRDPLPLWLEEGVATYMEGYVRHPDGLPKFRAWANLERFQTLRDAAREEKLIPLDELLSRTPQSFLKLGKSRLLVYYAQVWALAHFLAEGDDGRHRAALEHVLLDAARGRLEARSGGRLGPGVITAYFDRDVEALESRYLAFVEQIVRPGARERIVQGRSPIE